MLLPLVEKLTADTPANVKSKWEALAANHKLFRIDDKDSLANTPLQCRSWLGPRRSLS
jgi:hypothetical protein